MVVATLRCAAITERNAIDFLFALRENSDDWRNFTIRRLNKIANPEITDRAKPCWGQDFGMIGLRLPVTNCATNAYTHAAFSSADQNLSPVLVAVSVCHRQRTPTLLNIHFIDVGNQILEIRIVHGASYCWRTTDCPQNAILMRSWGTHPLESLTSRHGRIDV